MSNRKALMLNRKADSRKSNPDAIIERLSLRPGWSVADVGSGGGYFSLRFAAAVGPQGRVFAVDTDHELLDFVAATAKTQGMGNVHPIVAAEDSVPLEEGAADLIFSRNAYHHLEQRSDYFRNIARALKPGGRVAIIEYNGAGPLSFHKLFKHFTPKQTIVDEMARAGFKLVQDNDFLPGQSFVVFARAEC
jgi:ubiquinone/menaquinone biosynthesis C-methylase UbiE